jgi:hypothetical protein
MQPTTIASPLPFQKRPEAVNARPHTAVLNRLNAATTLSADGSPPLIISADFATIKEWIDFWKSWC